jgi:hypothetical protein
MNPARTFGPVIGVAFAYVLRGGGGMAGSAAAQGGIYTEARRPGQGLTIYAATNNPD